MSLGPIRLLHFTLGMNMRLNKDLALIALSTILIYAVIFAIIVAVPTGTGEVGWEADFSDVSNWNSGGVDSFTTDGDVATITSSSKYCHVVTSGFSSNLNQYPWAAIRIKVVRYESKYYIRFDGEDAEGNSRHIWWEEGALDDLIGTGDWIIVHADLKQMAEEAKDYWGYSAPAIKAIKVAIVSYSLTNTHHIEVDWIKTYNQAIIEQAKYWLDRSSPETLLTPLCIILAVSGIIFMCKGRLIYNFKEKLSKLFVATFIVYLIVAAVAASYNLETSRRIIDYTFWLLVAGTLLSVIPTRASKQNGLKQEYK